ncbi:diaminopimelate decarboxylase [Rufibacter glacialis]|uniref:Diaminopimelate decarboxylase n=1 Tax=Rufibacter glacialis TaxID=1259555 RepID=A0A5M8Q999_9BACT|nr:diaminopimelate decarboxylase [Rufibacter glacialis]KAA6431671.1 diaminopimelate decarboxylase [Rufibacter glacialis]GGK82557.1 diaminopimelate decarboxylase [Rufibacter glacialis]
MRREHLTTFAQHPTPFYAYDLALLRQTLDAAKAEATQYGYHVHYALKANANSPILAEVLERGFGADCVSGNEVRRALEAGFTPDQIVFAGVGKSDAEINFALEANIFCFNSESVQELEVIQELAAAKGKTAQVALRINPNVDAYTHKHITTGLEENKFGINAWELEELVPRFSEWPNLKLIGLHFHIGSQIMDLTAFENLCVRVNELQQWFEAKGLVFPHLNVGGGLGVDYQNPDGNPIADFAAYFAVFHKLLEKRPGQVVHFELGRALVAPSGTLVSKVLYLKHGQKTNFVILDAGMTELMRPALYQAYHKIENLSSQLPPMTYDVVGPICESTDCFSKDTELPETKRGDLVAIRTAGAYGEVMVSEYNLRDRVKAIYLD